MLYWYLENKILGKAWVYALLHVRRVLTTDLLCKGTGRNRSPSRFMRKGGYTTCWYLENKIPDKAWVYALLHVRQVLTTDLLCKGTGRNRSPSRFTLTPNAVLSPPDWFGIKVNSIIIRFYCFTNCSRWTHSGCKQYTSMFYLWWPTCRRITHNFFFFLMAKKWSLQEISSRNIPTH